MKRIYYSEVFYGLLLFILLIGVAAIIQFQFTSLYPILTAAAIAVTVLIFQLNHTNEIKKQDRNQEDLLKTLKIKLDEIEKMAVSYMNTSVPFYFLPHPDESFYQRNLDYSIDGKSTEDLKYSINRIQDKILIINFMMQRLNDAFNLFVASNNVRLNDIDQAGQIIVKLQQKFISTDKIFRFYNPRIIAALIDKNEDGLSANLEKAQCILRERYKIK